MTVRRVFKIEAPIIRRIKLSIQLISYIQRADATHKEATNQSNIYLGHSTARPYLN